MPIYIKHKNYLYTLIVLVLVATSGFPSFMGWDLYVNVLLLPVLYINAHNNKFTIPAKAIYFLFFIIVFGLIHFALGHLSIIGTIAIILTYINLIYVCIILKSKFCHIYIRIMYVFCVIALIIWSIIVINPNLHTWVLSLKDILPQFISQTWLENSSNPGTSLYIYYLSSTPSEIFPLFRNCGPFYEPGLFASYIVIALILNYVRTKKLLNRTNFIFILTLLTTMSSAGYISLAISLLYVAISSKKIYVKVTMLLAIFLLWEPIYNLDFMAEKIANNMSTGREDATSRFGAIAYHAEKVAESPIVGYMGGKMPSTSLDIVMGNALDEHIVSPNGLSYIFVYWGIPWAILFYIFLYRGLKLMTTQHLKEWEYVLVFLIVLSAAFSQTITTQPIILFFAIAAIIFNKQDI